MYITYIYTYIYIYIHSRNNIYIYIYSNMCKYCHTQVDADNLICAETPLFLYDTGPTNLVELPVPSKCVAKA